jgi:deoxyribodipyrimidine photo-lyase
MQASVTGINAPRLYNPVKQGHDHDPTGSFTRRWVPELVSVPAHWLQEPWKWPGAASLLGRRYPEPLADPGTALRAARARLSEIRNRPDFHDGKRAVLLRHGSRKGRVMVVEPVFAASGQLAFDI